MKHSKLMNRSSSGLKTNDTRVRGRAKSAKLYSKKPTRGISVEKMTEMDQIIDLSRQLVNDRD